MPNKSLVETFWDSNQIEVLHISELDPFAQKAAGWQRLQLVVRQLSDGSFLTMPAAVLSDGRTNPRMVLVAGQHGNEWNGPWILHQVANMLEPRRVRGTLVILPIANPLAFNEGNRVPALDSIDLNRTYGGGRPRKPTEHLGQLLWESVFSRTDYLIDVHSGGPGEYLPFAATPEGKDLELARALNLPYIHVPDRTKWGFLVDTCQEAGIRAVLIEIGGGRSLDIHYHSAVTDGILNALRVLRMLDGDPIAGPEPYIFNTKYIVPAPTAGFFEPRVALGQQVRQGDQVATITPILARTPITVETPQAGLVLYRRREVAVGEQDSLFHLV
jgi:predicted deacylase